MNGSATDAAADPELAGGAVLLFDDGIPGFPDCQRFVLTNMAEDSPFQLLEGVDQPEVSLIVTVPWLFFPDYDFELSELEQRELDIADSDEAVVFCAVTLDAEQHRIYLNLMGPFVVNARTRRGRQVVLVDTDLPLRAAVELG